MKKITKLFFITALMAGHSLAPAMQRPFGRPQASKYLSSTKLTKENANKEWAQMLYQGKPFSAEKIKKLIAAGADVNMRGHDGKTILVRTIQHDHGLNQSHPDIAHILLDAGADPNIPDRTSSTALILATVGPANLAYTRMLIDAGANVNAQNDMGTTPLMSAVYDDLNAVYDDSPAIVHLLLDAGADRTITNRYGETAADMARRNGKQKILELLEPPRKIK